MDQELKEGKPTRVELLIENYRESRNEGIKLAHSVFNDIAFTVALLGAIFTGGTLANEPRLQLIIPFLLAAIAIYSVQKLRVNNLITCYLVYLEKEINLEYASPVMIWNSKLIRKNISSGPESRWGLVILIIGIIVICILFGGICLWVIRQNQNYFNQDYHRLYLYVAGAVLILLYSVLAVWKTIGIINDHTPEKIEKLILEKGENRPKKPRKMFVRFTN